ncbi:MAG: cyclic nucleotide-binding domain-containing protein, partial [Magnetococcales bacterium]|nr:cyclic nucleotide-binding domain-containing protein [Magnetococcales bacterium]
MFDARLLDKIKFFSDLSQSAKKEISMLDSAFKKFPSESTVVSEGDETYSFFVLLQGMASVYKKPNINPINELKPGAVFGEAAFLTEKPRMATVIAMDTCIFLEFDRKILNQLS